MERTGADAYAYAKACGLYAHSWIGRRARLLFTVRRLQDLWVMLFGDEPPLIPEGLLALQIERRSEERAVAECVKLLAIYDKPDPVSVALVSRHEYGNLKGAVAALSLGKTERPFVVDIAPFSFVRWDRWPNLPLMTAKSPVSWLREAPPSEAQVDLETKLDHQYYRTLWDAVSSLPARDREAAEPLIREEIILANIVWALRLRAYYGLSAPDIIPLLALAERLGGGTNALASPAIAILDRPVDSWDEWSRWKYRWLLNPHEEGVPWSIDPRWAQLAGDRYLYRLALARFHRAPFTVGMLVSFFKIKELEIHMIRVACEGLRLGASPDQMGEFLEAGSHA